MKRISLIAFILIHLCSYGQMLDNPSSTITIDYENPQKFEIAEITITGNNFTDANIIIIMSGLKVGQTVTLPGEETREALENLWKQKLFSDIELGLSKVDGIKLSLVIAVKERPRLSKYSIKGLKKGETNNIRDEITLDKNQLITEDLVNKTNREIEAYFFDKGF